MSLPVTEKNLASRSRKLQSEFRKRQLIDATMDCIVKLGLSQTTLARIAERTGQSQSNLLFHFHSKEALLEQTLRFLSEEYKSNWQSALAKAPPDSISQLCALVRASFAASICNRRKISVWYAFWGESRSRPVYLELCGANDLAFSQSLLDICEALDSAHETSLGPATAALSIEGMIDGLWQNFLIGKPGFKRSEAINAVFELLGSIYPALKQSIITNKV